MNKLTNTTKHPLLVVLMVLLGWVNPVFAQAPINSNVALQPAEGAWIYRQQFRYSIGDVRTASGSAEVETFASISTLVYGLNERITLVFETPYVFSSDVRLRSSGVETSESGFGDLKVLSKLRLYRDDFDVSSTARFDLLAGIELPTGASAFSSDSFDPIVGGVYSYIHDRNAIHADAVWKFNTGGVGQSSDVLKYDLAYAYRLMPRVYAEEPTALFGGLELNGIAETNGDHEIFLSPGLQYVTQKWILEATIQIPVVQSLDERARRDFVIGFGIRVQF